ncbi:hypothetical protein ColLi_00049 [Colletotrichum liriopes]|uniref:Uncharacterized protein n=1 Tax=Colletotrichum liriopes TaxID=708192 RepID=A0AA37GB23_9PEZI|nr:hypothetical protein ColLi_00049 [Colletotrichum liriopes]
MPGPLDLYLFWGGQGRSEPWEMRVLLAQHRVHPRTLETAQPIAAAGKVLRGFAVHACPVVRHSTWKEAQYTTLTGPTSSAD